ncbi:MAG: hypothetical protein WBP93_15525 [Pyrinomonadaceae bacterium]
MSTDDRNVRPVFRVAAIFVGSVFIMGGLLMIALGFTRSELFLTGLCGIIAGAFFFYVGKTGANFYWKPESSESSDKESIDSSDDERKI